MSERPEPQPDEVEPSSSSFPHGRVTLQDQLKAKRAAERREAQPTQPLPTSSLLFEETPELDWFGLLSPQIQQGGNENKSLPSDSARRERGIPQQSFSGVIKKTINIANSYIEARNIQLTDDERMIITAIAIWIHSPYALKSAAEQWNINERTLQQLVLDSLSNSLLYQTAGHIFDRSKPSFQESTFSDRFINAISGLESILTQEQLQFISDADAGLSNKEIGMKHNRSPRRVERMLVSARRIVEKRRLAPNGISRVTVYENSTRHAAYNGLLEAEKFARMYYTDDLSVKTLKKKRTRGRKKGMLERTWRVQRNLARQGYRYYTSLLRRSEQEALRNGERYAHLYIEVDGRILMRPQDVEEFRRIQAVPMNTGRSSERRKQLIASELLQLGYEPARLLLSKTDIDALVRSKKYADLYRRSNGVICMRQSDVVEFHRRKDNHERSLEVIFEVQTNEISKP